ncbi:MAG: AMP-binding protein [Desulfovibrionaceae bacterium]
MSRQFSDFSSILQGHALSQGGKTAIRYGAESISYASLADNVARFAGLLLALGIGPGDSCVIALPDCPEFIHAFLGALHCGIVAAPVSPQLPAKHYAAIFRDTGASALVTQEGSTPAAVWNGPDAMRICIDASGFADQFARSAPAPACIPAKDGPHFMLFTSGSTGEPKGVPHTQRDMMACARHYADEVLGMEPDDVVLSASKMNFAFGLGNSLIFPLYHGATVVLHPGGCGPAELFALPQLVADKAPTLFFAVPSVYAMLLRILDGDASPLTSLRLCVSAGESLPAALYHAWRETTGLEIVDGIGSTEALHIYISNRPGVSTPGVTGRVVPGYELRLVGDDGLPPPDDQPGRLHLRGESLTRGYINRPAHNAASLLAEGWFDTGDIFVHVDDAYRYQGRADDLFKVGGNWVAPLLVEEVLREHPAVQECVVTGHDVEGLLLPVAHVVAASGAADASEVARELRGFVQSRLPAHMCPGRYLFREDLPRTGTGKINRGELKQNQASGLPCA